MTFPVHATVTTPTFRPQSWGLADDAVTVQDRTKVLEKDIKDVAIRAAAATMALQIGLMFVPVVGWALGAIISLVQFFTGKMYEKRVKEVIKKTADDVRTFAAKANNEVTVVASMVYDQEYNASLRLASSGIPLEGMGDFWSDARDKVKKNVAPIVRKISMAPVTLVVAGSRAVTSAGLKAVAEVSKAAGAEGFARDVRKFEEKGDTYAKDIQYRTEDPKRAHELLSGKETLNVAEKRAGELKATAITQITKEKNDAIALLQSPKGREAIRKQTAMALRGNPEVLARKAQLDAEEAALRASLNASNADVNVAIDSMQPTLQTVSKLNSTTAVVGTVLAAGAAFLAFR